MSKGARLRLEKKKKEAEEHKKRMAALKSKSGTVTKQRPKFDKSKLNNAFMSNAKTAKDDVQGWALDFDNPTQNAVSSQSADPKIIKQSKMSEETQMQNALANSFKWTNQSSADTKAETEEISV